MNSHTTGYQTIATTDNQVVIGKNNDIGSSSTEPDSGNYALVIGNGTGISTSLRSNALTVD